MFGYSFIPRTSKPRFLAFATPLIALVLTLIVSGIIFAILGESPWEKIQVLFINPFINKFSLTEVFLKATPLILIAVGLSIGFRANIWNIGAEGQFILGAIGATAVAMAVYPDGNPWIVLPLMAIAGMIFGMLYAWIVAFLKVQFNASEILVSLMLVYIAQSILQLVVRGPLQDPDGLGFPQSRLFQDSAHLPLLIADTRVHLGVLITVIIAIGAAFFMARHRLGFDVIVAGQAPRAAKYTGVSSTRLTFFTLGVAGALAGLAGMFEVAGPAGQLNPNISVGYGFTAIIVAFLGRLNPIAIIFAGLLIAATTVGGGHFSFGLPPETVLVVQGLMLFFLLAAQVFDGNKLVRSQ